MTAKRSPSVEESAKNFVTLLKLVCALAPTLLGLMARVFSMPSLRARFSRPLSRSAKSLRLFSAETTGECSTPRESSGHTAFLGWRRKRSSTRLNTNFVESINLESASSTSSITWLSHSPLGKGGHPRRSWCTRSGRSLAFFLSLMCGCALGGSPQNGISPISPAAESLDFGHSSRVAWNPLAPLPARLQIRLLEAAVGRPASHSRYLPIGQLLLCFCAEGRLNWNMDAELKAVLILCLAHLFSKGFSVGISRKILSASGHLPPDTPRAGRLKPPRATRALPGWQRPRPPQLRLPMPWYTAPAWAALPCPHGRPRRHLLVMLVFFAFSRPSEVVQLSSVAPGPPIAGLSAALGLIVANLLLEAAEETGILDESVPITENVLFEPQEALCVLRTSLASLWSYILADLKKEFHACCVPPDRGPAGHYPDFAFAISHSLRDLRRRKYYLQEAQRRGRMIVHTFLRQILMETRLLSDKSELTPDAANTVQEVTNNSAAVLSGSVAVGIPSPALVAPLFRLPKRRRERAILDLRQKPAHKPK